MSLYIKKMMPPWAKALYRLCKESMPAAKYASLARVSEIRARLEKSNTMLNKLYGADEISILSGPFKGMKYIALSNGSQLLPKLVGSYEEPIHKWLYEIIEKGIYSTIINIGCAEGYYAVGLSKAKSKPIIWAYDLDKDALANATKLSKKMDCLTN